jgi:hypothetical protein
LKHAHATSRRAAVASPRDAGFRHLNIAIHFRFLLRPAEIRWTQPQSKEKGEKMAIALNLSASANPGKSLTRYSPVDLR